MITGRIVGIVAVFGAITYGAFGGEYSTIDWWKLRRQVRREQRSIERLHTVIDSLAPYADALESDSATQERVAREKFGMLRSGEVGFRFEPRRQ